MCLGRPDGPVVLGHVREDLGNASTNSAFLVFLRLPGGRAVTLAFLESLRSFAQQELIKTKDAGKLPEFPVGTELALVRRALLIDASDAVVASALTESVQLRVFRSGSQAFHEYRLSRSLLFAGQAGGLQAIGSGERDFKTGFRAHAYDAFQGLQPGKPFHRGVFRSLDRTAAPAIDLPTSLRSSASSISGEGTRTPPTRVTRSP